MHMVKLLAIIALSLLTTPAVAQVLTPSEAFGTSTTRQGRPGMYLEPLSPSSHYEVNCSPSRSSSIFASAIRTGAAKVWMAGDGEYAVI